MEEKERFLKAIDFVLGAGATIKTISEWRYVKDKDDREEINKVYAQRKNENTPLRP